MTLRTYIQRSWALFTWINHHHVMNQHEAKHTCTDVFAPEYSFCSRYTFIMNYPSECSGAGNTLVQCSNKIKAGITEILLCCICTHVKTRLKEPNDLTTVLRLECFQVLFPWKDVSFPKEFKINLNPFFPFFREECTTTQ